MIDIKIMTLTIFAKFLKINPTKKVFENECSLAFGTSHPKTQNTYIIQRKPF